VVDEAKIMKGMRHERVVKFIGFDMKAFSIIMELMPRGSLSAFISENKKTMRWSTRYQMMLDVCEGMAFLHSSMQANGAAKHELFHQDLKSANILLIADGGNIRAKIGDFGLSLLNHNDDKTGDVRLNGGTKCYQAPVSFNFIFYL
jgi:serine/threonine protein kinase